MIELSADLRQMSHDFGSVKNKVPTNNVPLGICGAGGEGFNDGKVLKMGMKNVEELGGEGCEGVKNLAYKVSSCEIQELIFA